LDKHTTIQNFRRRTLLDWKEVVGECDGETQSQLDKEKVKRSLFAGIVGVERDLEPLF